MLNNPPALMTCAILATIIDRVLHRVSPRVVLDAESDRRDDDNTTTIAEALNTALIKKAANKGVNGRA